MRLKSRIDQTSFQISDALLNSEDLTQVLYVGLIVTHILGRGIGELGDRLTVAANHLHHHLQRCIAEIIGEIGTNTKGDLGAILEA